jgi:hypothetical protein
VSPSEERATRLREGLLSFGFILLLAAAAWTVALPELTKEPESEGSKPAQSRVSTAPTR